MLPEILTNTLFFLSFAYITTCKSLVMCMFCDFPKVKCGKTKGIGSKTK